MTVGSGGMEGLLCLAITGVATIRKGRFVNCYLLLPSHQITVYIVRLLEKGGEPFGKLRTGLKLMLLDFVSRSLS